MVTMVLVKLTDPVTWGIAAVVMLMVRRGWMVPIVAAVLALTHESVLTHIQFSRKWGTGIGYGFVASFIQCYLFYGIYYSFFKKKPAVALSAGSAQMQMPVTDAVADTTDANALARELEGMMQRGTIRDVVSLDEITRSTVRGRYTRAEGEFLVSFLKINRSNGLDTKLFDAMGDGVEPMMGSGVLAIFSPTMLNAAVLYVKTEGAKGVFGGRKYFYRTFVGTCGEDAYTPGATFKSFGMALTAFNNLYRSEGFLSGAALYKNDRHG